MHDAGLRKWAVRASGFAQSKVRADLVMDPQVLVKEEQRLLGLGEMEASPALDVASAAWIAI